MSAAYSVSTRWLVVGALAVAGLAGCGSNPETEYDPSVDAKRLYDRANKALRSTNYDSAIGYCEQLSARFPFSDVTKQCQLDLIYAYYKNHEPEAAVDQADQFIRENPNHPSVDYAHYIKGLAYFPRHRGPLEKLFRRDLSRRPPVEVRQSFSALAYLVQNYPDSDYAEDSRQRMVYLRNRLAAYENHVARYYMDRGAAVAAANRAKYVLENYPGAPQARESLALLARAYDNLGMADLAQDTMLVLRENDPKKNQGKPPTALAERSTWPDNLR